MHNNKLQIIFLSTLWVLVLAYRLNLYFIQYEALTHYDWYVKEINSYSHDSNAGYIGREGLPMVLRSDPFVDIEEAANGHRTRKSCSDCQKTQLMLQTQVYSCTNCVSEIRIPFSVWEHRYYEYVYDQTIRHVHADLSLPSGTVEVSKELFRPSRWTVFTSAFMSEMGLFITVATWIPWFSKYILQRKKRTIVVMDRVDSPEPIEGQPPSSGQFGLVQRKVPTTLPNDIGRFTTPFDTICKR